MVAIVNSQAIAPISNNIQYLGLDVLLTLRTVIMTPTNSALSFPHLVTRLYS